MAKKNVTLVQITEDNFIAMAHRIKKFLENDIVCWHSFDCGSRRHIPTHIYLKDDGKISTVCRYSSPKVTIVTPESEPMFSTKFIRVNYQEGYGEIIEIGDKVGFTGNRMHLRSKALPTDRKWTYAVYQRWDPKGGFRFVHPTPPDICEIYDEMYDGMYDVYD